MAYALGYFAADGCMIKNRRGGHFIEFTSIDKEILISVQKVMESNHRLSIRNKVRGMRRVAYRLQIGSKKIFLDLINLGFIPAKTHTLRLPDIPHQYFNHFVRGYFDGDGHVSVIQRIDRPSTAIQSGFTCGSLRFLIGLHTKLKEYARIKGGSIHSRQGYSSLNFSMRDSLLLYKYMYRESDNLYLPRKYLTFQRYYQIHMDR